MYIWYCLFNALGRSGNLIDRHANRRFGGGEQNFGLPTNFNVILSHVIKIRNNVTFMLFFSLENYIVNMSTL